MTLRSFASSYLIAVVLGVAGMPAALHAASRIGLYTDQTGSTCSFSGNAPGMVTAYVVVHPDPNGVQALRFSAPLPVCFGATFLYDSPPGGAPVTGSSPTGVQIAFPACAPYGEPTLALTITYYRNGSTTPCCAFPIEPDPLVGTIEVTDCNFNVGAMAPVISHFNADGSCPCADVSPPAEPINPSPADGATNVSMSTGILSWSHNVLDIDIASYDVYFGTVANPPLVTTTTQTSYPLPYLATSTQYHWRVVVRDNDGNTTSGPEWTFTTRAFNSPPNAPAVIQPASGVTDVAINPLLKWSASDVDDDPLRYDVYFGASPNPVLVATNQTAVSYQLAGLQFSTGYSWYVVVRDVADAETTGPTWTFTTRPVNYPPATPILLAPADNATFLSNPVTLQWQGSDADHDPMTYSLFFGTTNPPPFYFGGTNQTSLTWGLGNGVTYYWQVQAFDSHGASSGLSEVRSFRTNGVPTLPSNPTPAHEAQNQSLNTTLTWESSDPDPGDIRFDIYAGNSPSPSLQATNVTTLSFDVSSMLIPDHDFFWRIAAKDGHGAYVYGPLWFFHTKENSPPTQPYNPTPANDTFFYSNTLTWDASDEDSPPQVLRYDVYFGTENPPPQVVWLQDNKSYTPPSLNPGTRYYWSVAANDNHIWAPSPTWTFVFGGQPTAAPELPAELALGRNHPNPFNPQTIIPYTVPKGATMHVRIMIFDAAGHRIRTLVDETQSAGAREVVWRGENEAGTVVSSGIYYCVMDAGGKRFTQKLVLLK